MLRWALHAWSVVVVLVMIALPVYAEDDGECGPFPADAALLPTTRADSDESAPDRSEWLVVLPKLPDGSVGASDFRLGPEAEIGESRFSPVLCATIVRVVGPPGATPESLIASLPDGAAAVPNDVYQTAATNEPDTSRAAPAQRPDPYRLLQYSLDRVGADEAPLRGKGVRVAILDSRPALDHPDLASVELLETNRVGQTVGLHGTLIAGILAATPDNGFGIRSEEQHV